LHFVNDEQQGLRWRRRFDGVKGAATRRGPMIVSMLAALVFPMLMALAASSDLITMRISNRLVGVLVLGFFVLGFAAQLPLQQMAAHVGLALMVLAFGFAFFSFGWIGGGDAKLAAATSLWIGFGLLLPYVIYGALLGGALTLFLLAVRRWPLPGFLARIGWIDRLHDSRSGVPYGIALAIAGILVYHQTAIFTLLVV
jgi:prepilin peptidase CpaA